MNNYPIIVVKVKTRFDRLSRSQYDNIWKNGFDNLCRG